MEFNQQPLSSLSFLSSLSSSSSSSSSTPFLISRTVTINALTSSGVYDSFPFDFNLCKMIWKPRGAPALVGSLGAPPTYWSDGNDPNNILYVYAFKPTLQPILPTTVNGVGTILETNYFCSSYSAVSMPDNSFFNAAPLTQEVLVPTLVSGTGGLLLDYIEAATSCSNLDNSGTQVVDVDFYQCDTVAPATPLPNLRYTVPLTLFSNSLPNIGDSIGDSIGPICTIQLTWQAGGVTCADGITPTLPFGCNGPYLWVYLYKVSPLSQVDGVYYPSKVNGESVTQVPNPYSCNTSMPTVSYSESIEWIGAKELFFTYDPPILNPGSVTIGYLGPLNGGTCFSGYDPFGSTTYTLRGYGCGSTTPSQTLSASHTTSLSPASSASESISNSRSPSFSPSSTISITPSISGTTTASSTPTASISNSPSQSTSITRSSTLSITPTTSSSRTPISISPSVSSTSSATLSMSSSSSLTSTPSLTSSLSISRSSSSSPSLSQTISNSPTPSLSNSDSATPTLSSSISPSTSHSGSASASISTPSTFSLSTSTSLSASITPSSSFLNSSSSVSTTPSTYPSSKPFSLTGSATFSSTSTLQTVTVTPSVTFISSNPSSSFFQSTSSGSVSTSSPTEIPSRSLRVMTSRQHVSSLQKTKNNQRTATPTSKRTPTASLRSTCSLLQTCPGRECRKDVSECPPRSISVTESIVPNTYQVESKNQTLEVKLETETFFLGTVTFPPGILEKGWVVVVVPVNVSRDLGEDKDCGKEPTTREIRSPAFDITVYDKNEEEVELHDTPYPITLSLYAQVAESEQNGACIGFSERSGERFECLSNHGATIKSLKKGVSRLEFESNHLTNFGVLLGVGLMDSAGCESWIWISAVTLLATSLVVITAITVCFLRNRQFQSYVYGYSVGKRLSKLEQRLMNTQKDRAL